MAIIYSFTIASLPYVVSAVATDYIKVRITFSETMRAVDPTAINDALNSGNYTFSGGYRTITCHNVVQISGNVFELTVDEMEGGVTYTVFANANLANSSLVHTVYEALLTDPTADRATFIGLGEAPRLISVTSVRAGILYAGFSEIMSLDVVFNNISSYIITPQGDASSLIITGISSSSSYPDRAVIAFTGGSKGTYRLTVNGVRDYTGNIIDSNYNSLLFYLEYPAIDELESGPKLYFDTDIGTIQLQYSDLSSRRMEDLVILRTKNVGHTEQFKLISDSLQNAGVSRADSKLKLFKG